MTDPIDDAYALLLDRAPEYGLMGFANHAPMAVDALVALGRSAAVGPWLARYAPALGPAPTPGDPLDASDWRPTESTDGLRAVLGDESRFADWRVLFDHALVAEPWETVLDRWAARLAPGLIGAALHGLLRTAHATRALGRRDTPLRRRELAQGLAYWAATYHALPGDVDAPSARLASADALRAIPLLPVAARRPHGSIVDALAPLADFTPFHGAARLIDPAAGAPDAVLSDMTATLAAAYLANVSRENLIALVHFVTGPSAIRLLFPHVSEATRHLLLGYAWQAGAALYCAYGTTAEAVTPRAPLPDRAQLIDGAVATGDEHAIKFVEACLREDAIRPAPAFRAAARDAIERLASW
jgi:hypothetical protein